MGEEFGSQTPFLFFCDFEKDLAAAVTAGRRNEFARFIRFSNPDARRGIPDPNAASTFVSSRLDWNSIQEDWLDLYRRLLLLRRQHIVPRLAAACNIKADYQVLDKRGLTTNWGFSDGSALTLVANLSAETAEIPLPHSDIIYSSHDVDQKSFNPGTLPAWSVIWFLKS